MKHKLLSSAALALLLVGCSDDQEPAQETETPPVEQQEEQPAEVTPEKVTMSDEELAEFVTKAANAAFSTNEHEGSIVMQETHQIDEKVQQGFYHNITYRQNDALEGMYGEHQLYYKRETTSERDGTSTHEGYVQPDIAFYKKYDDGQWEGLDFQTVAETGYERFAYLAPADIMSMVEMNPDSLQFVSADEHTITAKFEPIPEDQTKIMYSIFEDQAIYLTTDLSLELIHLEAQLEFEKSNEALSKAHFQLVFQNVDNEKEQIIYAYEQSFTSYALTDEIRPPDDVFSDSGLNLWD